MCNGGTKQKLEEKASKEFLIEDRQSEVVRSFDKKFLDEKHDYDIKKIKKMTGIERVTYGLSFETEVEEVAPLDKSTLRGLSLKEQKAIKKAHSQKLRERDAKFLTKQEQEQEQALRAHHEDLAVLQMLEDEPVIAYATEKNLGIRLDPNNYVGGEDDINNLMILNEMERLATEFGLAKKDSPQAAGFTIGNLKELKEYNNQIRYMKWRMRNAQDILVPYMNERAYNKALSDAERNKAKGYSSLLQQYADKMSERITVMETAVQIGLSSLTHHKNFKEVPDSLAKIKRLNSVSEQYPGLKACYAKAVEHDRILKLYDRINIDRKPRQMLYKELAEQRNQQAKELFTDPEIQKMVQNSSYVPEAIALLKKALDENPAPTDEASATAYQKALAAYQKGLDTFSTFMTNYEEKLLLKKNYPDLFQDPNGEIYKMHQEKLDSEMVLVKKSQDTLAELLENLKKASHGTAAPNQE